MRNAVPAVLMMLAQAASAMDARDARGLAVSIERIAEPVIIDGLAMHVGRAEGPDIHELARRIEQRWRREGSQVLQSVHGSWQIRSRWTGLRSEVIQWRGGDVPHELLSSSFDVSRRSRSGTVDPVSLPSACTWMRRVEGRADHDSYSQMTARCHMRPLELAGRVGLALSRHEWIVLRKGDRDWNVARGDETARILVVPGPSSGESALVWITTSRDTSQ